MRRGEVWWAKLPEAGGRRPVLLLSRNASYDVRSKVIVAEITGTIRGLPVEVELDQSDGLPKHCCVNLDNIITIPKQRLSNPVASLTPDKMAEVREKIMYSLDLNS